MSNIRDVHPEKHNSGGQSSAALKQAPCISLLTVNRGLFFLFACLMVLVVFLGFLLFPANSLLADLETRQRAAIAAHAAENPGLSAEVNALKGQLAEMVVASIESKLRTLEENIRADNVTAVDLGTIHDIKNDIKILRNYSDAASAAQTTRQLVAAERPTIPNSGELLDEFSHLKFLIYISIASCGLMITAVGGVWLQNRYHLGYDKVKRLAGKNR
jgi:hypothetical protein